MWLAVPGRSFPVSASLLGVKSLLAAPGVARIGMQIRQITNMLQYKSLWFTLLTRMQFKTSSNLHKHL